MEEEAHEWFELRARWEREAMERAKEEAKSNR